MAGGLAVDSTGLVVSDNQKELVYKPVWFCIYCSDGVVRDATKQKLSAEHVIPFGLGGHQILPRASCKRCARITGMVEETCQHMILGSTRIRLNMPTRSPASRPTHLTKVFQHRDGRLESQVVPSSEFPLVIPGLKLPTPGILTGAAPHNRAVGESWVAYVKEEIEKDIEDGRRGLRLARFNNHVFCQMLAKIAHSFAVAQVGFHSFRPLLLDLILGRSETASYWVGGDMTVSAPDPRGLHKMYCDREIIMGTEYLIAYITLFSYSGTPEYRVVVGKWKGDA
jgi:hypothetical protein